ncbi:MAG: hypothetical protein ACI4SP_00305 [Eubacteriales bacterium]
MLKRTAWSRAFRCFMGFFDEETGFLFTENLRVSMETGGDSSMMRNGRVSVVGK